MRIDFYQLTTRPVEDVIPRIAERVLAGGDRLLIVSDDRDQCDRIDRTLWSHRPDSFLAHGRATHETADRQPILIGPTCLAANGATHIVLADGAWREDALAFGRIFHFFDERSIEAARAAWKALRSRDDAERHYWRQNDAGSWSQVS